MGVLLSSFLSKWVNHRKYAPRKIFQKQTRQYALKIKIKKKKPSRNTNFFLYYLRNYLTNSYLICMPLNITLNCHCLYDCFPMCIVIHHHVAMPIRRGIEHKIQIKKNTFSKYFCWYLCQFSILEFACCYKNNLHSM